MLDIFTKSLSKLFGTKSDRDLKEIQPIVNQILVEYAKLASLSNDQLRGKTTEFKKRIVDHSEKENLIRDLFIVGIETGARYSDFINIKPHYIVDNKLTLNPIKTSNNKKNRVEIPISSKFRSILNKRNGILPNYEGELTEFNKQISELAKKEGINSKVVIYKKIGGKLIENVFKKFELVSSHTCRRSFISLKFLSGMPAQALMTFSGHKTERSFLRYLKLENQVVFEKYKHYFN